MKVKVINKNTNQQFDCEEIIIDGFKYYINSSNKDFKTNELSVYKKWKLGIVTNVNEDILEFEGEFIDESNLYKIICCNNPNIDIPKVVDEVEKIAEEWFLINGYNQFDYIHSHRIPDAITTNKLFKTGYKESQKTYSNSDEDMIKFAEFVAKYTDKNKNYKGEMLYAQSKYDGAERTIDLLQLWKEQQPKIIYYNE